MVEFDAEAMLIPEFGHVEAIETDDFGGHFPRLEAICNDEYISNHHAINLFDFLVVIHHSTEGFLYLTQKNGLSIVVAPNTGMKVGVVALEEFRVGSYPSVELFVSESEIDWLYIPFLMSML